MPPTSGRARSSAETKRDGIRPRVMGLSNWVLGAGMICLGCGGPEQPASTPTSCPPGQVFDGRRCEMPPPAPPSAPTVAPAVPEPQRTPPSTGLATTSCLAPVTPIDVSAAQPVMAALLPLAAQKAMTGAKPVGKVAAAQFQQGQCLETLVNMSPGRCYSVVATALPGVQNLDLSLVPNVAIPGLQQVVAASDNSVGPNAVIGEAPNCFKWALPMAGTMKLIVSVSAGQGLAGAQVFEK